jgi:type I restriction-modification system DNA methylase subunit
MHTCDLQKIIFIPSNVFTNTGVKTCILYFIKKIETSDSLKIKIVFDKSKQNEDFKKRKYEFNDILQTHNVEFYDYNIETKTQNLIISVPIEKIVNNHYSLNYLSYLEKKELITNIGVELKTIGEISIFMKKSNRNASYGKETGIYPFFKSSMNLNSFIDIADYNEECVIIGTG